MLPKQHRLRSDKDFQKIWKRGLSFYTKILGFKLLGNNLEFSRIGIVVGNKISKKATVRNKLKRQLREIIGPELGKIKSGYDLIISVLPAATDKTYHELEKAVFVGLSHFKLL
jgi:ribonuclease P protein component